MADESGQPYAGMISDLRTRKDRLMQEAQKIDNAIAALEALSGGEFAPGENTSPSSSTPDQQIRVGEFHGLGIPTAARMILEKNNKIPLTTNDILRLLERSGRKIDAKSPVGNIYSSLKRNPEFTLVAPNTWGLTDWYPGAAKKKVVKSVAAKVEEIMNRGPISIAEATRQAEQEIEQEEQVEAP